MIGPERPPARRDTRKPLNERMSSSVKKLLPSEWHAHVISLPAILEEEFTALHGSPARPAGGEGTLPGLFSAIHSLEKPRTALCLSGGGIRSATFALGVLQGLARCRLLTAFDYLSTVSGGGYVGSWLSAWIAQEKGNLDKIQESLSGEKATSAEPEPAPVAHLRYYSNYLTPRLGLLSADTWTIVATVVRNLLLNWLLIVPVLVAAILLPRLWLLTLFLPVPALVVRVFFVAAALLVFLGFAFVAVDLPSLGRARFSQTAFLRFCLAPLVTATFLGATAWAWQRPSYPTRDHLAVFIAGGAALLAVAFLASWPWARGRLRLTFPLVGAVTGALSGLAVWWLAGSVAPKPYNFTAAYIVFGPGVVLVTISLAATVFNGLGSRLTGDEDREWWSRAGGWLLIVAIAWTAGAAISITGPGLPKAIVTAVGSAGSVAGVATALIGYYSKAASVAENAMGKKGSRSEIFLAIAAPVFAIALLTVLAIGAASLGTDLESLTSGLPFDDASKALIAGLAVLAAAGILAFTMSYFIDINKFSLHAMYRNRLVRAFLSAARPPAERDRDVSPFTGFSSSDNWKMSDLSDRRPLHVVNCTLNLVKANNLAWQERRAESFTVSRLHCGSNRVGYRPSSRYAGGITLGTAAAISGAAASPNMGYHSSPVVTFLMTFFNTRLGYWLGNPGKAGWATWAQRGPRLALRSMLAEALGKTEDENPYIYLSDGGHFENLGLYEMVLRRCGLIVVCDAGCDKTFLFDDLGNAVRKIRIDLGIPIEFRTADLSQTLGTSRGRYGAVADIRYTCVDPGGKDGLLVYLKASLNGTEPADVRNYAATHPDFPHESTADQWFSESQLESYRMLGSHVIHEISPTTPDSLDAFVRLAETYLGPRAERSEESAAQAPKTGKGQP
jgi:patatin-like phospholipase